MTWFSAIWEFDPFDNGPRERGDGEGRGMSFRIAGACLAFAVASMLAPRLLAAFAPAELEPLLVSDADMWHFADRGGFPLIEAAKEEGRTLLALTAGAQTFLAFAFLVALAAYFSWRGFASKRIRGWSHGFWVAAICLFFFAPAVFPELSVHKVDYALTSSARSDRSNDDACLERQEAIDIHGAIYGVCGLNSRMSPRVFLIERGLFVALLGAFVAIAFHDAGYRIREAMDDFSPRAMEESEGWRTSRTSSARGEAPRQESQSEGFGHRETLRQTEPISAEAAALQLLGVSVGASRGDVERAYRQLMKRAHPDHGGSVARAAALNQARDLLLRRRGG